MYGRSGIDPLLVVLFSCNFMFDFNITGYKNKFSALLNEIIEHLCLHTVENNIK